jgi:predicted MFS family arabinose efflux permease
MQQVHGYGALRTGLAFLPFAVGIVISTVLSAKLVERVPPRALATAGLLLSAAAVGSLSLLDPHS